MWLSKIEWDSKEQKKRIKKRGKLELGVWSSLVTIIVSFFIIFGSLALGIKIYHDSVKITETHCLTIEDKIIEVDYNKFGDSKTYYYFVLEDYGMVSVSVNIYNSYMIGDMYEYEVSYIPSK